MFQEERRKLSYEEYFKWDHFGWRFLKNEEKTTISCQNLLFPSWPDQRGKRNSKITKYLPKKHLIRDVDGVCKGLDNWRPKPNTWNNNNSTSKKDLLKSELIPRINDPNSMKKLQISVENLDLSGSMWEWHAF